ncbi:MAG TPA: cation:proton antiporter [Acidimicrobiales bacterium]|jgi:CPA2 family monovalent cation:H+ antiporter-2|nr:cation:proton antiporter [Acidimicrobiales bacterium]
MTADIEPAVILAAQGAEAELDLATVLLELGSVLLLLAVAGRLARRLGLSPIPFFLVAGLFLGEGTPLELEATRDFIEIAAQVGIVLLLLMLGLEYSGRELLASIHANRAAGLVDFVLNATPGALTAWFLGWGTTAAIFLGGITYISSSGIVSKVLDDLGRVGNRETPSVLSILVIEDLGMALILPVSVGLLLSAGVADTVTDIAVAAVAIAAAFAVTLFFGDQLSRVVFHRSTELLVLTVVGAALAVAGGAEQIHAPAAVAALLVGIALSGPAADAAKVALIPVRDLFAAVFFVFFGIEVDPATLPQALPAAAALAVVTVVTKLVTGAWAARRAGIGLPGRIRAGTVLIAHGEFSIILAGLALAGGIEPDLGPLAASYVLIVAIAGPLLARFADPLAFALVEARAGRAD